MSATYDQMAQVTVKAHIADEFMWEGDIVKLTGRYAAPTFGPASVLTTSAVSGTLHVEVKWTDKDAPIIRWVKFSDLKVVRSISK